MKSTEHFRVSSINWTMNLHKIVFLLSLLPVMQGCAWFADMTGQEPARPACSDRVIERAFMLYGEAKTGLVLFFNEHNDNRLYQAYYASWDSRNTAQSVRKCWDRRVSHFNAMKNLTEMNNELARVIRMNLPDQDPGRLIAIYREEYRQVMNPLP